MKKLDKQTLYSLEEYAAKRTDFRAQVMAHKKNRRLAIGPNATLYFEDRLTIQYQIQERSFYIIAKRLEPELFRLRK